MSDMSTLTPYDLHNAVKRCDEAEVLKLIHNGAPPDVIDELGMAPIHWAVYGGYTELVAILIEAGADVNVLTKHGTSALWHAEDDFGLHDIAALLHTADAKRLMGRVRDDSGLKIIVSTCHMSQFEGTNLHHNKSLQHDCLPFRSFLAPLSAAGDLRRNAFAHNLNEVATQNG